MLDRSTMSALRPIVALTLVLCQSNANAQGPKEQGPGWRLQHVTFDGRPMPACPSAAFYQVPGNRDLFIARTRQISDRDQCLVSKVSPTPYTLALFHMDWKKTDLSFASSILVVPAPIPLQNGGPMEITNALDPTAALFEGTIWIAFECSVAGIYDNSSCVAPYNSEEKTLDISHASVPIRGQEVNGQRFSASIPKLIVIDGSLYMHWTVVQHGMQANTFKQLSNRMVRVTVSDRGLIVPMMKQGPNPGWIFSTDLRSVELQGESGDQNVTDSIVEVEDVVQTDGRILFTSALSGDELTSGNRCLDQTAFIAGCYRLNVSAASSPELSNSRPVVSTKVHIPWNPVGYAHFIHTDRNDLAIMATFLPPKVRKENQTYSKAGTSILYIDGL